MGQEYTLQPSPRGSVGALASQVPGYLDGEWSPALTFDGVNTGITGSHSALYTRIGQRLFYEFSILLTSKGAATGDVEIYNLPYGVWGTISPGAIVWADLGDTFVYVSPILETGALGGLCVKLLGAKAASASLGYLTNADIANNTFLSITGNYKILEG